MAPQLVGGLSFVLIIILILTGIPVVYTLFLLGFGGYVLIRGWDVALGTIGTNAFTAMYNYTMTVVPAFILIGELAFESGIGYDLLEAARRWLTKFPGGMLHAIVGANVVFATMSGASIAASALFAKLAVPEMKTSGYDVKFACGACAGAGPLAAMIPPSVIMVLYCMLSDTSLSKLMMAGFLPGVMIALVLMAMIIIRCVADPTLAPPVKYAVTWKERFTSVNRVWPAVVIILAILGSIYGGLATPTEAAALGAVAMFLVCMVKRTLNWPKLRLALINTTIIAGMIQAIVVAARVFGDMMLMTGLPETMSKFVIGLGVGPLVTIIIFMVMYGILGCFMDSLSMMVVTFPMVLPIVHAFGIDMVWFGILIVAVCELGAITPPFGVCLFAVKGALTGTNAEGVNLLDITRGTVWFIACYIIGVGLLIAFPAVALWLPGTMGS